MIKLLQGGGKVTKKFAVVLRGELELAVAALMKKYGLTAAGAIRLLISEGVEAMQEQGRL